MAFSHKHPPLSGLTAFLAILKAIWVQSLYSPLLCLYSHLLSKWVPV